MLKVVKIFFKLGLSLIVGRILQICFKKSKLEVLYSIEISEKGIYIGIIGLIILVICIIIGSYFVWKYRSNKKVKQMINFLKKIIISGFVTSIMSIMFLEIFNEEILKKIVFDIGGVKLIKNYFNENELYKFCILELEKTKKSSLNINLKEIILKSNNDIETCEQLLKEKILEKELEIQVKKESIWGWVYDIKDWYTNNTDKNNISGWLIFSGIIVVSIVLEITKRKIIGSINKKLAELSEETKELKSLVNDQNEAIEEKLEKVDEKYETITEKVEDLNTNIKELEEVVEIQGIKGSTLHDRVYVIATVVSEVAEYSIEDEDSLSKSAIQEIIEDMSG